MTSVFLFLLILYAGKVKLETTSTTTEKYLDANDADVILWQTLFSKINTILSENESLKKNLVDVNQRLDELNKRFDSLGSTTIAWTSSPSWTSILRRQDDKVDFYRGWNEYREGFGDPNGNFFVGLQWLHNITTNGAPQELLVILKDYDNKTRYAKYDFFRVGSEAEKYPLKDIGLYTGDAGDAFKHHIGHKFTTFDQDNDNNNERNCAVTFHGAWWFFGPCYTVHLNGPYHNEGSFLQSGISWDPWRGWNYSLKYAEMMIRPKV